MLVKKKKKKKPDTKEYILNDVMYTKFKTVRLTSGDRGRLLATSGYVRGRCWLGGFQGTEVSGS